jgi:aromatic-L-amino-acid decarboxylase
MIKTSASDSALVAIVAARSLYQRDHPDAKLEDLVIYTTTQTHSLGSKAGLVLGLQVRAIDVVCEDQFALRGKALRNALEEDARIGRKPFIFSNHFTLRYSFSSLNIIDSCNRWNHFFRCSRQPSRNN